MASLKDRITARIEEVRARRPWVDHLVRMQEHYGRVGASQQAGAATYFAFLSFFPIMALAFFVVGWVAKVYPDARQALHHAINDVLPGLVGSGTGQISMGQIQDAAGAVGVFGLVGLLYAGLGWLSSLQSALLAVFGTPARERPNFIVAKLRDLATLVVLGLVLLVAVAVTGFVRGFSADVLDAIGISTGLDWLLAVLTVVVGLAANALLFFAMFVLLAHPDLERRSLWKGAALGAVGFEILKQLSGLLLNSARGQPAFQAFGIALILLVWINYFSRLTLYAAAYALTSEAPKVAPAAPVQGPSTPTLEVVPHAGTAASPVITFAAGAATMAVLASLFATLRRKK
ncbi:YihY/virulence factor BrkB family protein [Nocardioides sp. BP30]|uniref:YihY/virulence factor BrkB family protein n=1 Tax=Nocardioides sp. BP30 TaxID=3036374 RepID=UPI00246995E9|nr:YihY/virulence factor BrkB family protein [Nocardioides sp. BP30]WGL51723.1 YihY/virulence factor BrkB family protein [Nocardioides sp. BP30]